MRTADPRPFVSGIILAAGRSERMGRPKQLLPVAGRPLLQHVLDAAVASSLREIILVVGYEAAEVRAALDVPPARSVRIVVNPHYARGQSTSLRRGLRAASPRARAAAILLGDQPGVTASLIDAVAARFLAAALPVARPVYVDAAGRRVPGHPVFLARRVWPAVVRLRGDQGARVVMAAHPDWVLEVPVEGEPPADVDTPEDYERLVSTAPSPRRHCGERERRTVRSGSPHRLASRAGSS